MVDVVTAIAHHGYSILFLLVFLEAIGLPMPSSFALLAAGAAAAHHVLRLELCIASALTAAMLGDSLLYLGGRFTGWWLLSILCRVSANPESCILKSADSFYRNGSKTLLFAKFIPGVNTIAPPLAGSMGMRLSLFMRLDFVGASLYCGLYLALGYFFSDFIAIIGARMNKFSHYIEILIGIAVIAYFCYQIYGWVRARRYHRIPRITPAELVARMQIDIHNRRIVIADCRSHGYYSATARRIIGSVRIEPNSLPGGVDYLSTDDDIYLYCTCIKEATSARVAWILAERGFNVTVIKGGLRAWTKAGFPHEIVPPDDVVLLPHFN